MHCAVPPLTLALLLAAVLRPLTLRGARVIGAPGESELGTLRRARAAAARCTLTVTERFSPLVTWPA